MSRWYISFALFMTIAIMVLAIVSVPWPLRVVLLVPAALGAALALLKLRRSGHRAGPSAGRNGPASGGSDAA